ncbi:MAG: MBL fold metallo-hydrolase [Rhodospirillales bacterium]|nr:MBL fold metallo-hydrolase [Rhodospirillales bacterium]
MKRRNFRLAGLLAGFVAAFLAVAAPVAGASGGSPRPRIEITWLGGATMAIRFNALTILTDPTFGDGAEAFMMGDPNEMFDLKVGPTIKAHRRLTPFPGIALGTVDLVLLSHAHEDHFDQKAQADLNPALPMILPIADVDQVKAKGFKNLDGVKWGETRKIDARPGQVTITAIPAHHSRNPQMEKYVGVGNGYWIEFSNGAWKRTVYWTGDAFPTADVVKTIRNLGKPDIMVAHLGGVGTTGPLGQVSMGAEDVVALAAEIQPRKVLPIHHSTYTLFLEPIGELAVKSIGKPYGLDLISEGTTALYD